MWNFVNHWRQASCDATRVNRMRVVSGKPISGAGWSDGGRPNLSGGVAQCCTTCAGTDGCAGWTYDQGRGGTCELFATVDGHAPCAASSLKAGLACASGGGGGAFPAITPLPRLFRDNGYNVLGVGKFYHDGGRGKGVPPGSAAAAGHPAGPGLPPMADATESWTNSSLQFPNISAYRAQWGAFGNSYGATDGYSYLAPDDEICGAGVPGNNTQGHAPFCNPPVPLDGSGAGAHGAALCDFVTYHDAKRKLQAVAAAALRREQQEPFFLAVGIRRPHLQWRAPAGYADLYPAEAVDAPKRLALDASVNPVAYAPFPIYAGGARQGSSPLGQGPAVLANASAAALAAADADVVELRRHYYAAISWADFACGQVLSELDRRADEHDARRRARRLRLAPRRIQSVGEAHQLGARDAGPAVRARAVARAGPRRVTLARARRARGRLPDRRGAGRRAAAVRGELPDRRPVARAAPRIINVGCVLVVVRATRRRAAGLPAVPHAG